MLLHPYLHVCVNMAGLGMWTACLQFHAYLHACRGAFQLSELWHVQQPGIFCSTAADIACQQP